MSDQNKIKRIAAKGALTRFTTYFRNIEHNETIDLVDLENRLSKAEELLEVFNEAQLLIETNDPDCEINYDTIYAIERQSFEDKYFKIISDTKKLMSSRQPTVSSDSRSDIGSITASPTNTSNIKLPSLNLPTFDGTFDQWLFFRDSFNSIINDNTSLSNVQKFHYLRLSLRGIAADTIKSLQVCDANYDIAWALLIERFENKQLLVNNHIKAIFNLPFITKESNQCLRQLLDNTQKHLRALEVLQRPTQYWDDLIIYLLTTKFDNSTRRRWESQNCTGNIPILDDLLKFLKERCRILESLDNYNDNKQDRNPTRYKHNKTDTRSFVSSTENRLKCIFCNKEHKIYYCPDFLKLNPTNRLNNAKRLRLCINCLGTGHPTKDCRSAGCRKCGKIHHTMLHFENSQSNSLITENNSLPQTSLSSNIPNPSIQSNESSSTSTFSSTHHISSTIYTPVQTYILLLTAVVNVFDKFGNLHKCRVLLDNGSQSNFVSEKLCNILQLSKEKINTSISGVIQLTHNINFRITLTFKSHSNNFSRKISCLVLPKITGNLPYTHVNRSQLNIPTNLLLADQNFEKPGPVDLLIGADTFWDILSVGQIKLGPGLPIIQKTTLGWIISGPIPTKIQHHSPQNCYFSSPSQLDVQLTKFWELEECPKTKFVSEEDTYCENHFKQHISRHCDGRFITTLPLKESPSILGDSKTSAKTRFLNLERKLENNIQLKSEYHNFILEYIKLGHMSLTRDADDNSGFFLPHHCVFKELSTSTKLRVVFDGSAKTTTGYSLNDIMSLHEIAYRHISEHPKVASIILHDFYVDDLLTGCDTSEKLREIKETISDLLSSYGFPLRKWTTNDSSLQIHSDPEFLSIGSDEHNKTLGLLWNPSSDSLQYSINLSTTNSKVSKRQILSCTAQIFDPLGLLSSVIVTSKIILKELWKLKISWDESVPESIYTLWTKYYFELTKLNTLKIPRHVLSSNPVSVQLHGFLDASKAAYGACIYICCTDTFGNYTSNLYCAKTRVSPMKLLTIPRLELCGASLLSELVEKVTLSSSVCFKNITNWTDSKIVISWINTSPHLLKTFIANRVAQIQKLTNLELWKYVKTYDNPADLLSRGINPSSLINSNLWFHGPPWLTLPEEEWPQYTKHQEVCITSELPELHIYELQFPLSTLELNTSLLTLIKFVQRQSFPYDYDALSNSNQIDRRSKLLGLNPFFDTTTKLIRVGGRLHHSSFDFNKKHPIVLPSKHHLTILIARHEHLKLLHIGPQALLASLRENYWPISGRNLVRKIVRDCVRCFRFNNKPEQYLMGNLPESRITPSRPFTVSGVDYAGPVLLRDRKGRITKLLKLTLLSSSASPARLYI
ncbi:uncharacterized protein [Diabrotica undecimpunctata]|uniref:uncharacterized protein n=1 Tax=Diabrotica undecimpunctata TaxID=50387 RepID=UPI003B64255D